MYYFLKDDVCVVVSGSRIGPVICPEEGIILMCSVFSVGSGPWMCQSDMVLNHTDLNLFII